MASFDTLAFADFDVVTGRPMIDGFITADAGVNTNEAESGYVNGSRYSYANGTLPPVIIQTVKDDNTLVIGLLCRGDRSFDKDFDALVLAVRPQSGAGDLEARRLDIFPVWDDDVQASPGWSNGFGFGADDAFHPGTPPNGPLGSGGIDYKIRTKKPPRSLQFYSRTGNAGDWSAYTPFTGANAALYDVKVRSWEPPVAAGSSLEAAWGIEIRLPINKASGGTDWIDLQNAFGIYINVIRGGRKPASGSDADYYCTQFRFPDFPAASANSRLTGELDATTVIDPSWYGKGLINPSAAQVQGVRFRPGLSSVGRRPQGNTTDVPSSDISRTSNNDLVALLHNSGPAAGGITAEFRFGKWGTGPNGFEAWEKPSGLASPSPAISMAAGSNVAPTEGTIVNPWSATDVAANYPTDLHRCMWVQLNGSGVNFTQSSVRRNMDFVSLSSIAETAEISGVGYGTPANGSAEHDFVLSTRCRKIILRDLLSSPNTLDPETLEIVAAAVKLIPRDNNNPDKEGLIGMSASTTTPSQYRDYVVYLWITEGYRRTSQSLRIGSKKAEILDENPGSFGFVAVHKGVDDNLSWSLSGPGLSSTAPGLVALKVPVEGSTTININVSAELGGPQGDRSGDASRQWPLWLLLLLALILLVLLILIVVL